MPREHVESWQRGAPYAEQAFRVEVGWQKDTGCVQVATTDPAAPTSESVGAGLWVDLERQNINDLIRLLRKARDQAFGRDE